MHAKSGLDDTFTVSTGEVEAEAIDSTALGVVASELAWAAVLACFEQSA